jgi:transposase
MIPVPSGVRVWLAVGHTDMRRGMNSYVFRGRRADLVKIIWHDGIGMSLYAKRLERGRFLSYGLCQPLWSRIPVRLVRRRRLSRCTRSA